MAGHSRSCCFCTLRNIRNPPDETFVHLFFDCGTTNMYLRYFENLIFSELANMTEIERKKLWFLGIFDNETTNVNTFLGTCIWIVLFLIWESKLKKKTPNNIALRQEFFYNVNCIFESAPQLRYDKNKSNSNFCRNWDRLRRS